jgi:hypothetical protein
MNFQIAIIHTSLNLQKPHTKPTPATLTKSTRLAHKMNAAICSKRVLALVMFANSRFSTAIGI